MVLPRATPLPAMDPLAVTTTTAALDLPTLDRPALRLVHTVPPLVQVALDRLALPPAHMDRLQPAPTALTWPTVLTLVLTLTTAASAAQTLALLVHQEPQPVHTVLPVTAALDRPAKAVTTTPRATTVPQRRQPGHIRPTF
jgi:hypothetical protein